MKIFSKKIIIKPAMFFFAVLFLFILIFSPEICISGARSGLKLWYHSLIPSLLPFIILSNLIIKLNVASQFANIFHVITSKIFKVSIYGTYAIIMGFLCGYPMGAKITSDLYKDKYISASESKYLLCFVNNASPIFIQSYVAFSLFQKSELRFMLICFILLPAFLTGIIIRSQYNFNHTISNNISPINGTINSKIFDNCIANAFDIIIHLGGYLIIFSILANVVNQFSNIPFIIKAILISLIEITLGTYYISISNISLMLKIFLCSIFIILGGLSTIMQTKSVVSEEIFSIKRYLSSRLLSIIISTIIFLICIL